MPLQPPNLDTRKFADLLVEAQQRIPTFTPEWTDFNDSDPGTTLVQLFAWFTELMLYQMNRIPDRSYLTFLQLLNLQPLPPRAATAYVVFTMNNTAALTTAPVRTRFDVPSADGGLMYFETTQAIDLSPYTLDSVQGFDGSDYYDYSAQNVDGSKTFLPLGWSPQAGSALYLGFKPRSTPDKQPTFPARLVLRVFLPPAAPSAAQAYSNGVQAVPASQTLVWEYRSSLDLDPNAPATALPTDPPLRWRQLATVTDESQALTKEGNIIVQGPPAEVMLTTEGKLTDPKQARYWLRLRLVGGSYDAGAAPRVAFIRGNVIQVENLVTVNGEAVGTSDGYQQTYTLLQAPVADKTLQLQVQAPSRPTPDAWTEVPDLLAWGPTDTVYTLQPDSGLITFGDGEHGQIPPPQSVITAVTYLSGGGSGGNVDAGVISAPPGGIADVDSVTNPRPAIGGADEETLDHLKARAPQALRGDGRAVTLGDYQSLAEAVPGVAKAAALANRHPDYPSFPVPGAVMVVVVPDTGGAQPKPMPELRDLVYSTLDKTRLATTELFVADPRYRPIAVQATVAPSPQMTELEVKDALQAAVEEYFQPEGWDFGQKFYPSALYEVLLGAVDPNGKKYIQAVTELVVTAGGQDAPVSIAVQLSDDELPAYDSATVTVQDDS